MVLPKHYMLADEIANGAFCLTKRGVDLRNHEEYAVNIIHLNQLTLLTGHTEEDIYREVELCKRLDHPHVVRVFESYRDGDQIYVISELMNGMDLCYEIVNKVNSGFVYSEAVASHYMRQVLEGLAYIHSNGIVHRDMKPHNLSLASRDDAAPIKIGDFGIAIELPEIGYIKSGRIGTQHFMSPEVVKREAYGYPVDVWGCGIILYILLCGTFPFQGQPDEIFDVIIQGTYKEKGMIQGVDVQVQMESRSWDSISLTAKNLLKQMLEYNQTRRITAADALQHPWLKDREQFAERTHLFDSVSELKKFNARRKLKGAVLATMASRKLTSALMSKENGNTRSSCISYNSIVICVNAMCDVLQEKGTSQDVNVKNQVDSNNNALKPSGAETLTQLVDTLDDIKDITAAKNHDIRFLQCLFQNKKLQSLMEIHSLSKKAVTNLDVDQAKPNAEERLYEVGVLLSSLDQLDDKCKSLKNLLENHHILAMVQSHDEIIRTMQGQNDIFENYKPTQVNGGPENITRVRLVQFTKTGTEPMGITLRKDEKKHCIVARVINGGLIHRQGTLHVGDEIREINGINTSTKSIENLQQLLNIICDVLYEKGTSQDVDVKNQRSASGDVTFKIVPSLRNEDVEFKDLYFRCLFDYDSRADDLIPCQQAGVSFKCGDILQVASKADHMWWQARKVNGKDNSKVAGLIPSTENQERRQTCNSLEKHCNRANDTVNSCIFPRKKKLKRRSTSKYAARLNTAFDRLDLVTYEEVAFQKTFQRKTLVLIGAHGVGRRHIKNSLISRFPEKYAYPIPHTSRKPKPNERHGDNWNFESEEHMLSAISNHQFLEYGQHDGALYGTKSSTVRKLIRNDKIPVLDVETPALKILRCKEFTPYIVFISSPASFPHSGDPKMDASLQRLVLESTDLKARYRHLFDYTVVNHTIEDTVEDLVNHLQQLELSSDWIPAAWLY